MDVQLPNRDGFEATRAIREKEKRTGAPADRGDDSVRARGRCLAAGMACVGIHANQPDGSVGGNGKSWTMRAPED
jgi:CheY-like chemotaxis protein